MQRILDILISGLALLFLSPLLLPIALLLRLSGEGEVFFQQERIGKEGKPFKLFKFATMLKNSPNIGTGTVTLKNDPRVLPMGKFLRKTKINELPQLLNIFLGDMSLVGPRPQTQRCFDAFPLDLQEVIVKVKPGLSGIGPIIFRGEEEILADQAGSVKFYDNVIAPYKGQVEAWYVDHQSMLTYFTVILVTVWVVLFPSSQIVWRVFKGLPVPPDELKEALNYPVKDV
ncbi:MAG: sugar transferase [Pseudomonadales bacterium]|nr:sugar transferase [Pseudomonadales bacterium]MCP5343513.1 sugar transferase [Pseudomonadales bacterium]